MERNPSPIYPCTLFCVFKSLARVAALVAGLFGGLCGVAFAQISPGPLSRAHQQLEGVTKCSTCHDFGAGDRRLKCLECHTEIQRRVAARTGYHAKAYKVSPTEIDCARCHLEHNGQKFPLTRLDRKNFEHRALTGFALEGKHKEQQCEGCHTTNRIAVDARAEIKLKDLNHSFLGLKGECASCHEDVHAGQLGGDCLRCHSQDAWKPTPGFNHVRTSYPLTGRHQEIACQKCHGPNPGEKAAHYKGVVFGSCQNCHADPHKGAFQDAKFQGTCETCHNTSGWKNNQPSVSFNHNNTKFPLHGKHAEATCAQCHKDSDFRRPVAYDHCESCHEDVHKGQFASRGAGSPSDPSRPASDPAGSECSACHNETAFKPTLFTREMHQKSAFKLEGKHASLECAKCHQPDGKSAVYITGKLLCNECHADPHGGEFAGLPYTNKCDLCHTQTSFQPSTYSSVRHAQTKFSLTGAHAAVVCGDCHKPLVSVAAPAAVPVVASVAYLPANAASAARQYHFDRQGCVGCHSDPHRTDVTCETCHTERQWKELRPFDHASTKFLLEGAHETVLCAGCHKPVDLHPAQSGRIAAKGAPDFSKTPRQCSECHEDVHGGQFMKSDREEDCTSCHSVTKWSSGAFNHDATAFPLDGSHIRVRCVQCHNQEKETDGKTIRIYRGTPTECTKCH